MECVWGKELAAAAASSKARVYGEEGKVRLQAWKRADGKERAASRYLRLHRAGTTYLELLARVVAPWSQRACA